jgi:ABC-2 type transport system permease protein
MAQAIRGTLAPKDFSVAPHAWMTLIVWCALALIGAGLALRKRS